MWMNAMRTASPRAHRTPRHPLHHRDLSERSPHSQRRSHLRAGRAQRMFDAPRASSRRPRHRPARPRRPRALAQRRRARAGHVGRLLARDSRSASSNRTTRSSCSASPCSWSSGPAALQVGEEPLAPASAEMRFLSETSPCWSAVQPSAYTRRRYPRAVRRARVDDQRFARRVGTRGDAGAPMAVPTPRASGPYVGTRMRGRARAACPFNAPRTPNVSRSR